MSLYGDPVPLTGEYSLKWGGLSPPFFKVGVLGHPLPPPYFSAPDDGIKMEWLTTFQSPTPAMHYRRMYFEAFDTEIMAIQERFEQNDYHMYAKMEEVLILAASRRDYSQTLKEFYGSYFNASGLDTQLVLLGHMDIENAEGEITFRDIHKYFKCLSCGSACSKVSSIYCMSCLLCIADASV